MIAPVLGFGQGVQRYADGTAIDQEDNTFEWINYGTQDWAIENAEVVTYRDGTVIPQVTDASEWSNLTTGAWCYYNNDPSKGKLYTWYAVMGIHDNDENTPNKEFAPVGWRVPTDAEWTTLENYLIANGYNYDGTTSGNKIAKSLATKLVYSDSSPIGWYQSNHEGSPGNNPNSNNKSGFNAIPFGMRTQNGVYLDFGSYAIFFASTEVGDSNFAFFRNIAYGDKDVHKNDFFSKKNGTGIRFVRDAATASTKGYSDSITIYPNPTTSIVTLQGGKQYDIEVYTLKGKKVMALTGNTIDMSHLSSATYIVKALDKVENEEVSYKVVKN